jgi:hypothetical protein
MFKIGLGRSWVVSALQQRPASILGRTLSKSLGGTLYWATTRLTRVWWPMLILLKLRQMETSGVHMKGVLPWLVRWARCAGTRDFCPALDALAGLVHFFKIFPLLYTLFVLFPLFVSISQEAWQAVVPRHLSFNMCLWLQLWGYLAGPQENSVEKLFSNSLMKFSITKQN